MSEQVKHENIPEQLRNCDEMSNDLVIHRRMQGGNQRAQLWLFCFRGPFWPFPLSAPARSLRAGAGKDDSKEALFTRLFDAYLVTKPFKWARFCQTFRYISQREALRVA